MKLSFYGADQCVTGSCHCLEVGGKHILIDCGLQQGRDEIDNASLPFHPGQIDYVLVTHAHIDHSGRIPMLIKQGFQGRILTTRLTADLLDIMLQDSAHIQESDAEYKNRKNQRAGRPMEEPLYTVEDAMRVREFMDTCEYGRQIHICDGVDAVFIDAGHLLGSASIRLTLTEGGETRTIVFSGDIGNVDPLPCGCPGSQSRSIRHTETRQAETVCAEPVSRLSQWPVQIKLVPVRAPYFDGAKLLIAADCTAYAYAAFHDRFIKGHITLVGCPKLDGVDYSEKLTEIIRSNDIQSVTIVRMEVPCCGGLEHAAKTALQQSGKFIPWQVVTISTDGRILD